MGSAVWGLLTTTVILSLLIVDLGMNDGEELKAVAIYASLP